MKTEEETSKFIIKLQCSRESEGSHTIISLDSLEEDGSEIAVPIRTVMEHLGAAFASIYHEDMAADMPAEDFANIAKLMILEVLDDAESTAVASVH